MMYSAPIGAAIFAVLSLLSHRDVGGWQDASKEARRGAAVKAVEQVRRHRRQAGQALSDGRAVPSHCDKNRMTVCCAYSYFSCPFPRCLSIGPIGSTSDGTTSARSRRYPALYGHTLPSGRWRSCDVKVTPATGLARADSPDSGSQACCAACSFLRRSCDSFRKLLGDLDLGQAGQDPRVQLSGELCDPKIREVPVLQVHRLEGGPRANAEEGRKVSPQV